ncbi:unnamed protein product [Strongylus vulgaris]|uniref:Receptor L-domain domain-containing protein n=1 Tax=Strongylus vulgaris TaxID=40348 RepID=A0A3P7I8U8_STRVU|nr:unnamed protein product [Strongylus vulgaris]
MTVKKIKGVLHIFDNANLEKLDFFSGMEEIDAESIEERPALTIINNTMLEEIQFISLTTIKSSQQINTVIKDNPKLSGVDLEEWYEIAGGKNRTSIVLTDIEEGGSNGEISKLQIG